MKERAVSMGDRSDFSERLQHAGLVIRGHHRHQRGSRIGGKRRLQPRKIDDAVMVDRYALRFGHCLQYRAVFDRRHKHPLSAAAEQGQMVRLGAAADEHHAIDRRGDQCRDGFARPLDLLPRRAAAAMHRRRIAVIVQRGAHRRSNLGPQRCRRIPVEIGLSPQIHGDKVNRRLLRRRGRRRAERCRWCRAPACRTHRRARPS